MINNTIKTTTIEMVFSHTNLFFLKVNEYMYKYSIEKVGVDSLLKDIPLNGCEFQYPFTLGASVFAKEF